MPPLTSIEIEPDDRLEFPKDAGGGNAGVRLRLTNVSSHLVAFKVKSTARSSYVIKPSTGQIRRGEAAEVQIQRRSPEDTGEAGEETSAKAKRPDRFLVQAVVADTEERKLLLHAASRGKGQGSSKFWDGLSKEELEEKQLEAVTVDGIGNGAFIEPAERECSGDKGEKGSRSKGNGSKCAAAVAAGNAPAELDVDAVLNKISLPGRVAPAPDKEPPLGSDAPREGHQRYNDEPAVARLAPAMTLKKTQKKANEDVVINKHSRPVTCITCHPNGKEFITCAKDKLVCAWSCPQGEFLRQYEGHRGAVWACAVTSDGLLLLTCGADNMVLLWEAATAEKLAEVELPGVARHVDWAPSGERSQVGKRQFVACSNNFKDRPAALSVYDTHETTSEPVLLFAVKEPQLPSPATLAKWAGPDSDYLCTVQSSGEVLFWHGDSGELLGRLDPHEGLTSMVAFANDRSLMASCGREDMCVRLWDLSGGIAAGQAKCLQSYQADRPLNAVGLRRAITRADIDAAARGERSGIFDCLAGGGQDAKDVATVGAGTEDQFDPVPMRMGPSGEMTAYATGAHDKIAGHFGPPNFVCFSIDESKCISGAEDGNVRIRDLAMLSSTASPRPKTQAVEPSSQPVASPPVQQPATPPPTAPPTAPPQEQPPAPPTAQATSQPTSLAAALAGQPQPGHAQPKAQQPKAQGKSNQKAKVELATQISPNSAKPKQPPHSPPLSPLEGGLANRFIAIYDFDPVTTGWPFGPTYRPLPFSKGQEIEVLQEFGVNWSFGHIPGSQVRLQGLFPMNYVMPMAKYQELMAHKNLFAKAKGPSPVPSPVSKPVASPLHSMSPPQLAMSPPQRPIDAPSLLQQEAARSGFGLGSPLGLSAGLGLGLGSTGGLGLSQGLGEGLAGGGLIFENVQKTAPAAEDDEDDGGCSQS